MPWDERLDRRGNARRLLAVIRERMAEVTGLRWEAWNNSPPRSIAERAALMALCHRRTQRLGHRAAQVNAIVPPPRPKGLPPGWGGGRRQRRA